MVAKARKAAQRKVPIWKRAIRSLTKSRQVAQGAFRRLPLWADILTVLLFLFGLYRARVSLVPVIQPDSAISVSWEDLPITATNSGSMFALRDAQFYCRVTNMTWEDPTMTVYRYYRIRGVVEWAVQRPPLTIPPGATVTFPCDLFKNSKLTIDSGPDMPVALIHMTIRTKYAVNLGLFHWHREANSQLFTWRKVSGGYQWLAGDTSDSIK